MINGMLRRKRGRRLTPTRVSRLVQHHARTSGGFDMVPRKSMCSEAVCTPMPARPLGHTSCCVFVWVAMDCPFVVGRRTGTPRHLRRCSLCRQGLGDERHLVFECIALVPIRLRFQHLFQRGCTMSSFMNQAAQSDVMYFVTVSLQLYFENAPSV
jgi:hypothetical protein